VREAAGWSDVLANLLATAVKGLVGLQAVKKGDRLWPADYGEQVVESRGATGRPAMRPGLPFFEPGGADLRAVSRLGFVALQSVAPSPSKARVIFLTIHRGPLASRGYSMSPRSRGVNHL